VTEAGNKEIIRAAFDRWAAGTGGVFDLLAPDASWTIVGNSVAAGTYVRDDFMARVIEPFNARLSTPLVPTVRGLYSDDDMVVAFFDASATVRDGTPYRDTYTWYLRMRDGQIVEAFAFFDSVEFNEFWARVSPA
jgi:ketosteroid isomerase-like protein